MSKKCATFQDGRQVTYESLVSTIPLPQLMELIEDLPISYKNAASKLRFVSVLNLNIGINRENISGYHWIYFPEPEFPFYRVGFYTNFSKNIAPKKTSSMYIEISHLPGTKVDSKALTDASIDALRRCGILRKTDSIIAKACADIKYGYVIFDRFHKKKLSAAVSYLQKNNIFPAGRYGAWTYSSMEDSIVRGREIAKVL